jgi:hypothetical protein
MLPYHHSEDSSASSLNKKSSQNFQSRPRKESNKLRTKEGWRKSIKEVKAVFSRKESLRKNKERNKKKELTRTENCKKNCRKEVNE